MIVSSAGSFSVSMAEKGLVGAVFMIAVSKSVLTAVEASIDDVFGTVTYVGNHLMV